MKKVVLALEGLVHAGKSTLLRSIKEECPMIRCIGEYVEFTEERFPCFPKDVEEARKGHAFFLDLERKRKQEIRQGDSIIILDRSIFSILAYHYAAERLSDSKVPYFVEGMDLFRSEDWLFPQVCVYLDVNDECIALRHQYETGFYQSVFLKSGFNALLREFYERILPACFPEVVMFRIDAHQSEHCVASRLKEILAEIVGLK